MIPPEYRKFIVEVCAMALTLVLGSIVYKLRSRWSAGFAALLEKLTSWKIYPTTHIKPKEIERDFQIYEVLIALRADTEADRAHVFKFHNGTLYSSKNQVWKVSCVNESVQQGFGYVAEKMKNMLSSHICDLLYPLWNFNSEKSIGVENIAPRHCTCLTKTNCNAPHGVYFFDIEKMRESNTKSMFRTTNTRYALVAPLIDADDNIIGFCVLNYCWDSADINQIKDYSELLCKKASVISVLSRT